jgi:hypothetical protein
LGILAEFDSDVDIMDIKPVEFRIAGEGASLSDLYCGRGSNALEPQKAA